MACMMASTERTSSGFAGGTLAASSAGVIKGTWGWAWAAGDGGVESDFWAAAVRVTARMMAIVWNVRMQSLSKDVGCRIRSECISHGVGRVIADKSSEFSSLRGSGACGDKDLLSTVGCGVTMRGILRSRRNAL